MNKWMNEWMNEWMNKWIVLLQMDSSMLYDYPQIKWNESGFSHFCAHTD